MKSRIALVFAVLSLVTIGCGSEPPAGGGMADAALGSGDRDGATQSAMLPTWQLEDVQPLSPRAGQTYGLEAFSNHIVVVTLAEGF
jgi:hypothetical protein